MARYPEILAGNRITAQLMDSMLADVVVKAANESVTSSTTFQDDDELFVTVEANAQYKIRLYLLYSSSDAGDIEIGWTGPSGATMDWGMTAASNNTTSVTTVPNMTLPGRLISETNELGGSGGSSITGIIEGTLTTSSTAGTLQFRWTQGTSDATATIVRAGSTLSARRIA